ncbi:glycoside hydrolase family 15 protein [Pyxidicoccus parkwayensis]|uniref:Glycoside hydrolase family 15 protein n=1 Tax=Pyxidicoccus parkwayensis TaxID=2813578 RepID=A0ABX7NTB6_9BACT|nr:glycoside hydrolase family 15 protein [Pyxidicoccus parkwaysis]QSQ22025.1 glycoside hydrolase family 15 protein [Pyxidicoccus parkwaysis]
MALPLEDYALIGDTQSAALVGKDGSIDWLCWPRFDSDACFAALLGDASHGRWLLAPAGGVTKVTRRYRPGSLVLETDYETEDGVVRVVDCMPPRSREPDLVRVVQGLKGSVPMRMELLTHFGYGDRSPWVRLHEDHASARAGPDSVALRTPVKVQRRSGSFTADFPVDPGARIPFVLSWHPSHEPPPPALEALAAVEDTEAWWKEWSSRLVATGPWHEPLQRSLITLKALTYSPTGGIVAAPTTSLPLASGGRPGDARICWLRDATSTLQALLDGGYLDEARAWRDWLVRAVAGEPDELQSSYGVAGERRFPEQELPWLPGYEGSRPVRIGHAPHRGLSNEDVGEVMGSFHESARRGLPPSSDAWALQRAMLEHLEGRWLQPSATGPALTYSKVMAWVAVDRTLETAARFGLDAPMERWKKLRADVHAEVCREGFDSRRGAFARELGGRGLDARLLRLARLGFLPADDARVRGTVEAVARELGEGDFVRQDDSKGAGVSLVCSFWLADSLHLMGRRDEARVLFERLLNVRNDVGLLPEEYDPRQRRMAGNFPHTSSHVALVQAAMGLSRATALTE